MKIIWEENDIDVGSKVILRGPNEETDDSEFGILRTYLIGYMYEKTEKSYCLISIADGLIVKCGTKGDLVKHLNSGEFSYFPVKG